VTQGSAGVSRETPSAPEPPPSAVAVFGPALPALREYAELLATDGVQRGLIGPREVPRLWPRHLVNCAAVTELVPEGASVADVGSGAGLPGLVLAVQRHDLRVTLIEPLLRRATFLTEVVDQLGLHHVTVVRARAEELAGTVAADVVTARAVAALPTLIGWTAPLLQSDGQILALKGELADQELVAAAEQLARYNLSAQILLRRVGDEPTRVVRLTRSTPSESTRSESTPSESTPNEEER
jgi:16S rRNA (guanine527-N7)-methyltransferase